MYSGYSISGKSFHFFCSGLLFVLFVCSLPTVADDSRTLPDVFRSEDLLWESKLGTHQYTIPRIDRGRIFIGVNDRGLKHPALYRTGGGIMMCLDQATGEMIWQHDCNPPDYRERNGQKIPYSGWKSKSPDGPSEIIATPVIHDQHIYVAIGQSPIHGPGQGMLSCIDGATGRKVWESRSVDRTLSDMAIDNGLLYISDFSGRLHCFDADTGELYWQHELDAGVWCASPVVYDGKVCISTERNRFWVFKAGRQKQVLAESRVRSMAITPTVRDGVFYLPTQNRLFALKMELDQL